MANFVGIGIAQDDIVDVVFEAATSAEPIGLSGQDRPVFVVNYRGQPKRVAVTVSANGFVVGANPISPNGKLCPLP